MSNEYELLQSEISNDLVPVNETEALKVADNLSDSRRYCRPWTRDFLQDISHAFYEAFHAPLQVNSLVRTADQQAILRRHNHFAAPAAGDTASTHLAGVSVDLSRRGLSNTQYQWIRAYLQPLQLKGLVNPIEERQPVLHVVVFEKYSDKYVKPNDGSEASEPTEADFPGYDWHPAVIKNLEKMRARGHRLSRPSHVRTTIHRNAMTSSLRSVMSSME